MSVSEQVDHQQLMDSVYRYQRHIYDVTRKYYLLDRDRMIDELQPPLGGSVLEIGCGTGRNLIGVGRRYETARLFGIDISHEMLHSTANSIGRAGLIDRVRLLHGDASAANPAKSFHMDGFDRVFFSYTLSMIPDWTSAIAHAVDALAPGGRLHIVDFGTQRGLPKFAQSALRAWLAHFHVTPRAAALKPFLEKLAARGGFVAEVRSFRRDYVLSATLTKPGATSIQAPPS